MSKTFLIASTALAALALAGCNKKEEAPAEAPPAAEAAPAPAAEAAPAPEAGPAADQMAPADGATPADAAPAAPSDDRSTDPVSRGGGRS